MRFVCVRGAGDCPAAVVLPYVRMSPASPHAVSCDMMPCCDLMRCWSPCRLSCRAVCSGAIAFEELGLTAQRRVGPTANALRGVWDMVRGSEGGVMGGGSGREEGGEWEGGGSGRGIAAVHRRRSEQGGRGSGAGGAAAVRGAGMEGRRGEGQCGGRETSPSPSRHPTAAPAAAAAPTGPATHRWAASCGLWTPARCTGAPTSLTARVRRVTQCGGGAWARRLCVCVCLCVRVVWG